MPGPAVAWIGDAAAPELAWARQQAGRHAEIRDLPLPLGSAPAGPADDDLWPALVLLASDGPARWSLADAVRVSRRWPLAPLVSVASTLVEGRRRSGPALPGIEEVPWCDLPSRLAGWLADLAAGRRGTLGLPVTSRREDRVIEAATRLCRAAADGPGPSMSVAAARPADLEGLGDLLAAAGYTVARRSLGRPPLDEPADVLVWDVERCTDEQLSWLRMLTANRPALAVVLVVSFPRREVVDAATAAGAAAVLGRPLAVESLAGALVAGPR
jgi:hypothetical protein